MHEVFIDYLVASVPESEKDVILSGAESVHPIPFFKRGYRDELGKRYYFGHPKTDNAHIVMSGTYMHNSRVVGWRDNDTLRDIIERDGKVKRIDIAITDYVEDDLITPECILREVESGRVHGAMAKYGAKFISSVDDGKVSKAETVYIGDISKRGRKGVFRAYDKGLELGIMRDIITRLELEERGDNAHNSEKRAIEGASLSSVIESRLRFTGERMQRFFVEDAIDTSRGDSLVSESESERMQKRYDWLMSQVAPAVREFVAHEVKNGNGDKRVMAFLRKCGIISPTTS